MGSLHNITASMAGAADGAPVTFDVAGPAGGVFVDGIYRTMARTASGTATGWRPTKGGSGRSAMPPTLVTPPRAASTSILPWAPSPPGPSADGYWLATEKGGVVNFGAAQSLGDAQNGTGELIVAMWSSPSGAGYSLVDQSGALFAFGDATDHPDATGAGSPVADAAPTPAGDGYWVLTENGTVVNRGPGAGFFGDLHNIKLPHAIVAFAPSPTGQGYWIVMSDGGVFAFGDAGFFGSADAGKLNQPIFDIVGTSGAGYWLMGLDGQVVSRGDASFFGSAYTVSTAGGAATFAFTSVLPGTSTVRAGDTQPNQVPTVGSNALTVSWVIPQPGYWLVARDGGIFAFGDEVFHGSTGGDQAQPADRGDGGGIRDPNLPPIRLIEHLFAYNTPMGYRGKVVERELARGLRREGGTLEEIAGRLRVAKSSVSLWVRDVPFTPRLPQYRSGNRSENALHLAKLREIEEMDREGLARLGMLTDLAFLAAGTALYLGEGSKTDGDLKFANTDPRIVRFFCTWLRRFFIIDEARLRVHLYLHEGLDLDAAEEFWSRETGIPRTQFGKAYRGVPDKGIRHSKHEFGCISIRYGCTRTHRAIMGLCRALVSAAPG